MAFLQGPKCEPSMSLLFAIICLAIFLKFVFKKIAIRESRTSSNLPPSPPKLPIIGNLHQLGKNPHISLRNLAQKYGPILYLQLGQVPTVIVSSARIAKEALKTHDLASSNRPQIVTAKCLFYNCTDMANAPYGDYWRYVRRLCILKLFSAKRIQSSSSVREEEVARLVLRIAESYPRTVNLSKDSGTLC